MHIGVLPTFSRELVTDPDWVSGFVSSIEAEGAESVWAVEHVIVAKDYEPRYSYSDDGRMPTGGAVMPDPLEWLSFAAAATTSLKLATGVVVLPLHSPVVMAKRVATLDALSRGRMIFGVGSGWQIEEYQACNSPYEERGARLDEYVDVLRDLWQPGYRTHQGAAVSYTDVESVPDPHTETGPPIVIGGSTGISARRAGRVGDGWYPYVISPEDYARRVETIRATAKEHGRDPGAIELTVWPGSYDFSRSFDVDLVKQYTDVGVDRLIIAAAEARSSDPADIGRLVGEYREKVVDRL